MKIDIKDNRTKDIILNFFSLTYDDTLKLYFKEKMLYKN